MTRGRLWGRLEGVKGRQAKLGQVWSLAVLAGHFLPPYCAQHGLPQAGEIDGGKGGGGAAKGRQLECVWLEARPGRRAKRGLRGVRLCWWGVFPRHIAHSTDYHSLGRLTVGGGRRGDCNMGGWRGGRARGQS